MDKGKVGAYQDIGGVMFPLPIHNEHVGMHTYRQLQVHKHTTSTAKWKFDAPSKNADTPMPGSLEPKLHLAIQLDKAVSVITLKRMNYSCSRDYPLTQ